MSPIPEISIKREGIFLSTLETISINATFTFTPSLLSSLTRVISSVVTDIRVLGDEISNQRGKDPDGEILHIYGLLPKDESEVSKKTGVSVEFGVNSEFSRFDERKSLIEKITEIKSIDCPEWINLNNVYKVAPFFPKQLRFGLQFYQAAHISAMLGIAPKMVARVLVESNEKACVVSIEDRCKKNSNELLYSSRIFRKLSEFLKLELDGRDALPRVLR